MPARDPMAGKVSFFCAVLALLALAAAPSAVAAEIWTPQAGEVDLDEPAADEPQSAYRHACALVGAGRYDSAIAQLRDLARESEDPAIAEQARYMIGYALFLDQRDEEAFEELGSFIEDYPESRRREDATWLRLRTARRVAQQDLGDGLEMLGELIEKATDADFAALCRKERGDALLSAEKYLRARDEFLALIDYHPYSEWVAYSLYKVAECDLKMAFWLDLGTEPIHTAERELEDFITSYPAHGLVPQAQGMLEKAAQEKAGFYANAADFYIRYRRRPDAAVPYLRHIVERFPRSAEADWAAGRLEELEQNPSVDLRGDFLFRRDALPGIKENTEEGAE